MTDCGLKKEEKKVKEAKKGRKEDKRGFGSPPSQNQLLEIDVDH
jgi:hypothetical protein